MRAVFTIDIPSVGHGKFPSNQDIVTELRQHGWEFVGTSSLDEDQRVNRYKELSDRLMKVMPEVRAAEEAEHVIYYGELQDEKTKFIVTRVVDGQMTFRLLHPNLAKLERSTERVIRKLLTTAIGEGRLHVSNNSVVVYERGHEDIIIQGHVISRPFREAISANRKDVLLILGSFLILVPNVVGLFLIPVDQHRILGGTLERLSTALATTIIVSGLGYFQTYYELRIHETVKWTPYAD